MGDTLQAGTGAPGEHSLATYLEEAFDEVRVDHGLPALPEAGRDDRVLLFLGIARGLLKYLGEHSEAFVIESHRTTEDDQDYRHDEDHDGYVRIRVDDVFPRHP
jgi:hypothetical protein